VCLLDHGRQEFTAAIKYRVSRRNMIRIQVQDPMNRFSAS